MNLTEYEIHNKEIKDECDSLLNYFRFVRNATKDKLVLRQEKGLIK